MLTFAVFDHQCKLGVPGIDWKHLAAAKLAWVAPQEVKAMLSNCLFPQNTVAKIKDVSFIAVAA